MEAFVVGLIIIAGFIVFFTRKRIQRNEDDIERLIGATTALEKALYMTLVPSIVRPSSPAEEMERDDLIDMLIRKWDGAMMIEMSRLVYSPPQQKEGYRLIHEGFVEALQSLKKEPEV